MKNKEILKKIKIIGEIIKEIRRDNNLINQDLNRHALLVNKLRDLMGESDIIKYTEDIEEILVLIDINKGFTITGNYQNPYMEALVDPVNDEATKVHNDTKKMMIVVNEAHTAESREFQTLNPTNPLPHCIKETEEAEYAEKLQWILEDYPVFEKNSTMAGLAPGYLDMFLIFPNLKRVRFAGGITPMCLFEGILTTIKYFDQHNLYGIEVIAEEGLYDTYDAPWHNRDEWNEMTNRFMNQAGVQLIKKI